MKKTVLILLLAMLASGVHAYKKEVKGFGGLRWGDPQTKKFTLAYTDFVNDAVIEVYVKDKEIPRVYDLEFETLLFYFTNRRLTMVEFTCDLDTVLFEKARKVLQQKHGRATINTKKRLMWFGRKSHIGLAVNEGKGVVSLLFGEFIKDD